MKTTCIFQRLLSSTEGIGGLKESALAGLMLMCRAAKTCWRWLDPSPPDRPTRNDGLEGACTLNALLRETLMQLLNSCPPLRCRSSSEKIPPSRALSGVSSRRKGGCKSCRSPSRCSSTACPWCGRACASFGRSSLQNVDRSRESRTQTASHLKKNASHESL